MKLLRELLHALIQRMLTVILETVYMRNMETKNFGLTETDFLQLFVEYNSVNPKYAKGAGIIGTGISVGVAGYNIVSGQGTTIDYFDVGLGITSIGAAIFLASNSVGCGISVGAAVYFAGRLVYNIYEEFND